MIKKEGLRKDSKTTWREWILDHQSIKIDTRIIIPDKSKIRITHMDLTTEIVIKIIK